MEQENRLFRKYVIYFLDGSREQLYNVAISTKHEKRTVFIDKEGCTVFVVPDSSVQYIAQEDY